MLLKLFKDSTVLCTIPHVVEFLCHSDGTLSARCIGDDCGFEIQRTDYDFFSLDKED